ncbi:MAG TPA: class F sortase [Pilimelia sp.]|nr:class F sortase [Pilimelia sp.]
MATRPATRRPGWSGPLAVVLVFAGLFATGAGLGLSASPLSWPDWFADNEPPPRAFPVLEPSPPTRLRIPALKVRAKIHGLGLAGDGTIAVPPLSRHEEAGWYSGGPSPGQFGPAIIVGHADTRDGPSVFHSLRKLRPGQTVEVTRRDRRVAVFRVNSVERFNKSRVPADRVYGDYRRPGLRLITCGGRWLGSGPGYADNVVVFASLVEARGA